MVFNLQILILVTLIAVLVIKDIIYCQAQPAWSTIIEENEHMDQRTDGAYVAHPCSDDDGGRVCVGWGQRKNRERMH